MITAARPPLNDEERGLWYLAGATLALMAVLLAASTLLRLPLPVALGLPAALVVLGLSAWRPVVGLSILVVAVPLTSGLGKDTVIPLFRTSEALIGLLALSLLLHLIWNRRHLTFIALDLGVAVFTVGGVLAPWLLLYVTGQQAQFDTWRKVFGPLQFLAVYVLFSRSRPSWNDLRWVLSLGMLTSVVVALAGVAQIANVPGVREFFAAHYIHDIPHGDICGLGTCRATSFLEYWSPLGGYCLLNFLLALSLSVRRDSAGFSPVLLALVMSCNAAGVMVSLTLAAIAGLVLGTVLIGVHARRFPHQALVAAAALGLLVAAFWPQFQGRISQQFFQPGASSALLVESLQTRERYWDEFFIPLFQEHLWLGTGTVISTSDVPSRLTSFVDNEYLGIGFRAGLLGEAMFVVTMVSVLVAAWRQRRSPDEQHNALGGVAFASVVVLAIMGATAEYSTYAGPAQQFWMVVGLLAARGMYPLARAEMPERAEPAESANIGQVLPIAGSRAP